MSYFLLKSHKSGKCIDTTGRHNNGQEVHQWDCDINNPNQQWVMTSRGQIKHRHSNKCLDSNKRDKGARFYLWDCSNRDNANQKFVHHSTAIYFDKGLCMDNTGGTHRGAKVHMWQCDPNGINQKWDKVFHKSNAPSVNPSKPAEVKVGFVQRCQEFPNKFKNEMIKVFDAVKNAIVNALKKIGSEIQSKLGTVIEPIKKEIVEKFSEFFIAITKFFDTIINLFKPFALFFASIGGLFVLAPFLSVIFFITVLFWLIGIPPFIVFFALLGGVGWFLFMVVLDIRKASSYIFKQIFAVFGLITGRLFTSIIPVDKIKNAFYNVFNKINVPINLSGAVDKVTSGLKSAFDAICNAFGEIEKLIKKIRNGIDTLLQPIRNLINKLNDIKNGVFGFFEDIGKAIAGHFRDTAAYTADQMKNAAKTCKENANITDPFGTIGSCGQAFGKGLLNSAGALVAPVVDVAKDVGNAVGNAASSAGNAFVDAFCFTGDTQIIMSDGSYKLIKNIEIGDKIIGWGGTINTVTCLEIYDDVKSSQIYGFNNITPFFTDGHVFMTTDGWKSINPKQTELELPGFKVQRLQVGDIIFKIKYNNRKISYKPITIKSLSHTNLQDDKLYNLGIQGNNSYHANNFATHNMYHIHDSEQSELEGLEERLSDEEILKLRNAVQYAYNEIVKVFGASQGIELAKSLNIKLN